MPLVRLEVEELACDGVDRLARRLDADFPRDDEQQRRLLHLMLAQLLPGLERDQDDATLAVLGMQDHGRARPVGRRDLVELPVLHAHSVTRGEKSYTYRSLDSPA